MRDATEELSIGQVAERTGLSAHTPRFYERQGLVPVQIRRSATGRRVYNVHDVQWLEICTNLRASGMPLEAIRRYAELVRQKDGNERERLELLRTHREPVTEQIDHRSPQDDPGMRLSRSPTGPAALLLTMRPAGTCGATKSSTMIT